MVTKEAALAATATLVAVAFALSTLERFLARRRRHDGAWTVSLFFFAVASGALWLATAKGWDPATFRVFYLFGAIVNVPWLALGTVYLLAGRRIGDWCGAGVVVVSAFAAGVIAVAPMHASVRTAGLPQGSDLFGPLPRVLAAVCSGVAALVIVAGALWSAWRLWHGRARSRASAAPLNAARRLALGNLLIAAGTLVLAGSGTLNARLGAQTAFAVTLVIGISLLFVGFLVATPAPAAAPSAQPAPKELAGHALR